MTKQQIAAQLQKWIAEGKLKSKVMTNKGYYEVRTAIKRKELYLTKVVRIYATDIETAEQFNALIDSRLILTLNDVMLNYPQYNTMYAANNAAALGVFLKFIGFGNIPLYICGE